MFLKRNIYLPQGDQFVVCYPEIYGIIVLAKHKTMPEKVHKVVFLGGLLG